MGTSRRCYFTHMWEDPGTLPTAQMGRSSSIEDWPVVSWLEHQVYGGWAGPGLLSADDQSQANSSQGSRTRAIRSVSRMAPHTLSATVRERIRRGAGVAS